MARKLKEFSFISIGLIAALAAAITLPATAGQTPKEVKCNPYLDSNANVLKQLLVVALRRNLFTLQELKNIKSLSELVVLIKAGQSNANTFAVKSGLQSFLESTPNGLQANFLKAISNTITDHEQAQTDTQSAKVKTKYIFFPEVTYQKELTSVLSKEVLAIHITPLGQPLILARAKNLSVAGIRYPSPKGGNTVSLRKTIDQSQIGEGSEIPDPPLPYYLITKTGAHLLLSGSDDLINDKFYFFEDGKSLVVRLWDGDILKFDLTDPDPQMSKKLISQEQYFDLVEQEKRFGVEQKAQNTQLPDAVHTRIGDEYTHSHKDNPDEGIWASVTINMDGTSMLIDLFDLKSKESHSLKVNGTSSRHAKRLLRFTGTQQNPILHILNKNGHYIEISLYKELSE